METFKTEIDGRTVYECNDRRQWAPCTLCDGCLSEMVMSDKGTLSIIVAIMDGKTKAFNQRFDIHETCLPVLMGHLRRVE